MNNLSFGGSDARRDPAKPFTYYETIAGGTGGAPELARQGPHRAT